MTIIGAGEIAVSDLRKIVGPRFSVTRAITVLSEPNLHERYRELLGAAFAAWVVRTESGRFFIHDRGARERAALPPKDFRQHAVSVQLRGMLARAQRQDREPREEDDPDYSVPTKLRSRVLSIVGDPRTQPDALGETELHEAWLSMTEGLAEFATMVAIVHFIQVRFPAPRFKRGSILAASELLCKVRFKVGARGADAAEGNGEPFNRHEKPVSATPDASDLNRVDARKLWSLKRRTACFVYAAAHVRTPAGSLLRWLLQGPIPLPMYKYFPEWLGKARYVKEHIITQMPVLTGPKTRMTDLRGAQKYDFGGLVSVPFEPFQFAEDETDAIEHYVVKLPRQPRRDR
ncbi:MAG: hypothetical protein AB7I79_15155 [Rhizobiaceae bacterium]